MSKVQILLIFILSGIALTSRLVLVPATTGADLNIQPATLASLALPGVTTASSICPDIEGPAGVGIEDVRATAAHWRQPRTGPDWDGRFDLDGDENVDVVDMMLATVALGTSCLPPEPETVAPPLDLSLPTDVASANEFLYTGANPVQTGVVSGTIEARRVAVLRGTVSTRDGKPLSGVKITVLDHPEFGQTLTRLDGMFDLAANGGGWLTVNYARAGYLPAQRKVDAPWHNYAWLPDVALIQQDPNVTPIDLTANVPMQVARGSVVSDTDGVRRETLFFPQGTAAWLAFANGMTQTVTTLHVRVTEYTVGPNGQKAMPAELPPNSAYTYATEFSADEATAAGAKDVWFNRPIISYVENFLGFTVGVTVPMGYYDGDRAVWVAADSGRVVKILSVTAGKADLDVTGSGTPASPTLLTSLGVTDAERAKLAELYTVGRSLWRVPVPHFTRPWDKNQGTSCEEPCPTPPTPGPTPKLPTNLKNQNETCGSVIGCQKQTLGEVIDIVGTPFRLHYQSDRALGYLVPNMLDIPLTGPTISPKLRGIALVAIAAGSVLTKGIFTATPNLSLQIQWNGKDGHERYVQGKQSVLVGLTYLYPLVYRPTNGFGNGGNATISIMADVGRGKFDMTSWWYGEIGAYRTPVSNLGGWSLSTHHVYDPQSKELYLGTGERRSAEGLNSNVIQRVAGNGLRCPTCVDGIPATTARMWGSEGVAVAPDGQIYIADGDSRVKRVDASGIITTVAGGGACTANCDGLPATQVRLYHPAKVAFAPDGSYYIAERTSGLLRKVNKDGIITTIAGTGIWGYSGDNGPALQAQLYMVFDVAIATDGTVYLSEQNTVIGRGYVRRIGTDGIITTIAGKGRNVPIPVDGMLATDLENISSVHKLKLGPNGRLYMSWGEVQPPYDYIGYIDINGRYYTLATNRNGGCSPQDACGDGLPARTSPLGTINGIDVGPDGTVYFASGIVNKIRTISADGILGTIAGSGVSCSAGPCGDDGPARQATLVVRYSDVTLGPDGLVYFTELDGIRVRRLKPALPGVSSTDILIPSEDGSETYIFSSAGRHLRTVHALTGATLYQFAYDSAGRLGSVTDGDGNVTTITRDADGNPTGIVAPFGQVTTFTRDQDGYLAAVTNPASETIRLGYAPGGGGLLTSFRDARNNLHTFQYDSAGRLIRDDNSAGGFSRLARLEIKSAYSVTLTTAMSRTTEYRVESLPNDGQKRVNTFPDGLQSEFTSTSDSKSSLRSPDGMRQDATLGSDPRWGMLAPVSTLSTATTPGGLTANVQVTRTATLTQIGNPFSLRTLAQTESINGRKYTSIYDGLTRVMTDTTPAGRQSTTTLDAQGRPLNMWVPGLLPVSLSYDSRGRLGTVSQGSGAETRSVTFAYGSDGYLAAATDPLNRMASFAYDAVGHVTTQTLSDGRVIHYGYDANSNLTSLTPPGRPAHTFTYTPADLQATYTPPDVGSGNTQTSYTYNLDQQLTRLTRPEGKTIDAGYDFAGRTQAITITRGVIGYAYHPTTGNLNSIRAPGGISLSLGYDGSLLKGQTWTGPISGSVGYSYDNNFRRTSDTVNGANAISYGYDNDSLLTGVGALTLSRNAQNGLLTGSALGSITDSHSYNGFGEPISYTARSSGTPLLGFQYAYDKLGRIVTRTETISGTVDNYVYGYDLAGRLERVRKNGATISTYSYDSNGNRLGYTDSSNNQFAGSYDAQDRLTLYGSTVYTYTANGELQSKSSGGQTTTYTYDELGNLTQVILPNRTQIDYLIDGFNRRIGKKVNGVLAQGFLYDGQLRVVAELDGSGTIVSRFIYGTHVSIPDYMIKGGLTYRILTDHLGSPRLVVDVATGVTDQTMAFDEFGRVLSDTNPGFQPFGFAGGLYDRHTGLVRFGARDYDVEVGRWTVKDPIGFASEPNLYNYVVSDPVNLFDPMGLDFADWMHQNAPWFEDLNLQPSADFSAGFGDVVTGIPLTDISLTGLIREWDGTDRYVNRCSNAYLGGMVTGVVWQAAFNARGFQTGHEFKLRLGNRQFRVAPWGNRTGNPYGQAPHYHRNIPDPNNPGNSIPGGGIGRHRPWQGW